MRGLGWKKEDDLFVKLLWLKFSTRNRILGEFELSFSNGKTRNWGGITKQMDDTYHKVEEYYHKQQEKWTQKEKTNDLDCRIYFSSLDLTHLEDFLEPDDPFEEKIGPIEENKQEFHDALLNKFCENRFMVQNLLKENKKKEEEKIPQPHFISQKLFTPNFGDKLNKKPLGMTGSFRSVTQVANMRRYASKREDRKKLK